MKAAANKIAKQRSKNVLVLDEGILTIPNASHATLAHFLTRLLNSGW